MDLIFEQMAVEHGKDVIDIFNYYIENSYAAFFGEKVPYEFFQKFLDLTRNYPAFVIKSPQKKIIGFCFLKPYNPSSVFKETAAITYFIQHDHIGKGVGENALYLLENEGRKMGIRHIMAEISSLNETSMNFHLKNGFKEKGRFPNIGFKKNKHFDIVWMQKDIG